MIYDTPTIYNIGKTNNSDIDLHESIIDYASDWVDISSDFQLVENCVIFKAYNTPGTISDLNAKLSKEKKLLYFDSVNVRIAQTNFNLNDWNGLIKYIGNEIKFIYNGGANNPIPNNFIYPKDVNRGTNLYYMIEQSVGGSTKDYALMNWVGDNINNTYLAISKTINNNTNGKGIVIGQLCFDVELV